MSKHSETDNIVVDSKYEGLNQLNLAGWLDYFQRNVVFEQVHWMGIPTLKNALDMWVYQEIIFKVRPDIIVEMGSYKGGSTLYLAQLLENIGHGKVLSVDIDHSNFMVSHDRITILTGSTQDQKVIASVKKFCENSRVMIIHDADHSESTVLADLFTYADLVSQDSYFIVEDGVVDLFPPESMLGGALGGPGPLPAIRKFLKSDQRFVVDSDCEKFLLTHNPCGYLKKTGDTQENRAKQFNLHDYIDGSKEPDIIVSRTRGELRYVQKSYLELMQSLLVGTLYRDASLVPFGKDVFDAHLREHGLDWPLQALTMIGVKRLANLRKLTEAVIVNNIPGDFIETGVWRGGACIMMRAILYAYNITDRCVWAADSFSGLPSANESKYPADMGSDFHEYDELAVSLEEVQDNFRVYGLLDDQVKFLKGWFKDTLPSAEIEQLALLRLDGDMYESTMDALTALYPKLSAGGYVIIDDYHIVPACKSAVNDYCRDNGIDPEIIEIDGSGVYWQKQITTDNVKTIVPAEFSDAHISRLYQSVISLSQDTILRLSKMIMERDNQINALKQNNPEELIGLKQSIEESNIRIVELEQLVTARDTRITELSSIVNERDFQIDTLLSSTSWRISFPVRFVKNIFKRIVS